MGELMKKYILGIILVIAVIFVSGCITSSGDNSGVNGTEPPKTMAKNGVLIKYPGSWVVAQSDVNNSIMAVADPKFKDSVTGFSSVNVNIQKKELPSSLDTYFNQTYSKLFSNSSYTPVAIGNTSIGSYNALEAVYTQEGNGSVKQHRAIWIENNGEVFVILCTAPQEDFQNQIKNFDFILNNFRIT